VSVPGDDGSITLLGRGSLCINTGGEKVFPEEVEEALETHPAVRDSTVVGVPDPAFGEAVGAIVSLTGDDHVSAGELIAHVKGRIAGYKAPRHLLIVDDVERSPNGKADYAGARRRLLDHLSTTSAASAPSD
jgi:3-oxocholest-4-en-26-oate---CoA ligase